MKKRPFFFIVLVVSMMAVPAYATERAIPVFDARSWKLGWSQNQGGAVFEEYVVNGESVDNWSELVTVQFFPGLQKQTNPDIFEASLKSQLSSVCHSMVWDSLYQSDDERIWKWSIQGCSGQKDQSEIARLKKTSGGFHVWHYAIKKAPMPEDNEKVWLENLKAISIEG